MLSRLQPIMQPFFDLAGELVVALDIHGNVSQVNHKTCEVLGFTQEEIVGQNWLEMFLPPQIQDSVKALFAQALVHPDSDANRFTNPVLTCSGTERMISWRNMVLRNDDGQVVGVLSLGEDITDRLEAEKTLQESEQRYRTLFEETAEGILGIRIASQCVYLANPALCSFFGYTEEELTELNFEQLYPADAISYVQEKFKSKMQGNRDPSIGIPCLRKDGEVVYADIKCNLIQVDGESCLVGYFTDVTERVRAELAAQESESKYRQLVEAAPHGIKEVDLTGTIIYANPASSRLYGFTQEELVGRKVWDQAAGDPAIYQDYFSNMIKSRPTPTPYFGDYLAKDGTRFQLQVDWDYRYNASGELIGFVSVQTDITERLQSEKVIRESESRLRAIMNSLRETTIVVYEYDGRISSIWEDDEMASLYGIKADEIIGKHIEDILPPNQAQERMEQVRAVIRTGKKIKSESINTLQGGDFWYDSTLSPLVNDDGTITSAVGFLRDITEQRKTESALRENESQLRSIMNSLQESCVILYDYDGQITQIWAGESYSDRYQTGTSDYIGKKLTDVLSEKEAKTRLKDIREVIDTRCLIKSQDYRTLPGGDFWFDITLGPLIQDDGSVSGAVGFIRDITDRRNASEALVASEKRFQTIMASLHKSSVLIYNREGRIITMWGDNAQDETYGLRFQEVIGKLVSDFLPADESRIRLSQIEYVFATGKNNIVELCCTLPNGRFWIESSLSPLLDDDGQVVGVVGFGRDITDRKLAEQALQDLNARLETDILARTHTLSLTVNELEKENARRREVEGKLRKSEENFRGIVEASPDWIWETDIHFNHLYSNHRVQDILGFSVEELMELDFTSRFHPDDEMKNLRTMNRCVTIRSGWVNWVKRIRHKDGEYRYIESNATPVINEAGVLMGYRGVDRDITKRVETEKQLEDHKSSLAHVARMSTMGATVSGLAHELNQPLSALSIYADACAKMYEPKLGVELGETLGKIANQAERAGKIIRRVQQFARKSESHRSTYSINELTHESVGFIKDDAKLRGIRISLRLAKEIPSMVGDPIRIQQVIMNLIRNGFDSMMLVDASERILSIRTFLDRDSRVIISVQDSGVGFQEENSDQIFESFFTTKPDGMGLGLSISRSIIESHSGNIVAQGNADRGASFIITLPICIGAYCENKTVRS